MSRPNHAQTLAIAVAAGLLLSLAGCERTTDANPDSWVGIGVELTMVAAGARVVSVFKGGPAAAAGVQPDDVFLEVDDQPLRGMSLAQAVTTLRGEQGTEVRALVRTADGNRQLTMTRAPLEARSRP